jgi:hypothetical protein
MSEGDRRLELVVPSGYNVALPGHHRLELLPGDVGGIVLLALPELGVEHAGAFEEIGFGRSRRSAEVELIPRPTSFIFA